MRPLLERWKLIALVLTAAVGIYTGQVSVVVSTIGVIAEQYSLPEVK